MPAPCMMVWFGNGGSNPPAWPASVPMVSTPTPSTSRSWASIRDASASKPGLCGPSAATFRNAAGSVRVLQPVRSSTHAPLRNPAVLALPGLDAAAGEQEVRVRRHVPRDIDDACRADEAPRRNRVAGVVGQILAGYPVNGRVEVRAGVLAEPQRVPVPRRARAVVLGNDLDRHPRRRREDRRQSDDRRRGSEWLRQVDDAKRAACSARRPVVSSSALMTCGASRRYRWNANRFSSSERSVT